MVRIAPVRLDFNPKTLWFDAQGFELSVDDCVVVETARGSEFGKLSQSVFDADDKALSDLKSPLKPVKRLATDEDIERARGLSEQSLKALPVFKKLAAQYAPDMNPVAVEYLFDGDKAVFYFDSEERIDFRELVRQLSSELHIKVDMKQVGIRDGARMVGGLGHCGQELCCRRLGGEFNPVSIRMAKEQDLSLNPQKISGVCGRLMCCLRYEFETYKEFHSRSPKKNAVISTPDGDGKVISLDVPREIVSIQVGNDKPVKVPLSDMETLEGSVKPNSVGEDAWELAKAPATIGSLEISSLFTSDLNGKDALSDRSAVRHVHGEKDAESESQAPSQTQAKRKRRRRRRSTTVESGNEAAEAGAKSKQQEKPSKEISENKQRKGQKGARPVKVRQSEQQQKVGAAKKRSTRVGRNSSSLRAGRPDGEPQKQTQQVDGPAQTQRKRRRRTHKAGSPSSEQLAGE